MPETWLEGRVGGDTVRVFIEAAGSPKESGLWGFYYRTKDWTPIPIEGEELAPGSIQMYELDPRLDSRNGSRLDLTLATRDITGTWTSSDEGRTLPVRLRRVPQPASYQVALKKSPRRFADPRWPMEFPYPAGWLLQVSASKLLLRSPDPLDMMFDNVLTCKRGRGLPSATVEVPFKHFMGSFFRTPDGWMVASAPMSDCPGHSCKAPSIRRVGSTLFMRSEIGYRSHNPWGYAGIADADEYLIVAGSEWAHCRDRLLDSDTRIQPKAQGPKPTR